MSARNGVHAPVDAVPRNAARTREPLIDAATLAIELGVSRAFVYEHAAALGALKLGGGPRARLRFDPVAARDALACYSGERSQALIASAGAGSEPKAASRGGRRPLRRPELLPDRPRRKAASA